MYSQRVRRAGVGGAPDLALDLAMSQHPAGVSRKQHQDLVLDRCELQLAPVDGDQAPGGIDAESEHFE